MDSPILFVFTLLAAIIGPSCYAASDDIVSDAQKVMFRFRQGLEKLDSLTQPCGWNCAGVPCRCRGHTVCQHCLLPHSLLIHRPRVRWEDHLHNVVLSPAPTEPVGAPVVLRTKRGSRE